jgi:protein TonB
MAELTLQPDFQYGAPELKYKFQKYTTLGLTLAAIVHFIVVGTYWASVYLAKEEEPVRTIRIMKYSELGPPPSISGSNAAVAPAVSVASQIAKPSIGIPVPVPDAEVNPEQSFATQAELSQNVGPVGEGSGSGDGTVIEQDIQISADDEPPPDFVPFQNAPTIVRRVEPTYPDIAKRAGLEGKVWAKVWIDKEGKVRQVVILKSQSEIFNQAVIDALKQWVFTPALMSTGPVAVWMSIPIEFKLHK